MLYIISGSSRSGKTIVAKRIMEQCAIPYVSIDWLVMGFTKGIPEYGIHDKLWPNEIAEKIWSFLQAFCENLIWSETDYVIEGEAILPELVIELVKKFPDQIRLCFLGFAAADIHKKVKEVYEYSAGKKDWLTNEPHEYVESHIRNMIDYSKTLEEACGKCGIRYFDTSKSFSQTLENIMKYLLYYDQKP